MRPRPHSKSISFPLAGAGWRSALAFGCGEVALASAALPACALRQLETELGFIGSGGGSELPSDAGGDETDGASTASEDAQADDVGDAGVGGDARAEGTGDGSESGELTGSVFVDADIQLQKGAPYPCPGIAAFSITPAALGPGQAALLDVALTGPPAGVRWTAAPAGMGRFSDDDALAPSFTCAGTGTVTVTVRAALLDGGSCLGVRFTSFSGTIRCGS